MKDKNIYLLVCDDCNGDGNSNVEYVMCGTIDEVRDEMRHQYEDCLKYPAECFVDGDVEWDDSEIGEDHAWMGVDTDKLGYDRHISWWLVKVGPKPDRGPMYALVKGINNDGGGITTDIRGAWSNLHDAQQVMLMEYGRELTNPSFYAGWDPEYCECGAMHALCEVETMDMTVSLDLLEVVNACNRVVGELGTQFEYLG